MLARFGASLRGRRESPLRLDTSAGQWLFFAVVLLVSGVEGRLLHSATTFSALTAVSLGLALLLTLLNTPRVPAVRPRRLALRR